tara:strand:- start:550 stop:759 length:210 start_codon:yes stop_codon:yes gene_type:complete
MKIKGLILRLNDFDMYYPSYNIRIPDDLNNEKEFISHTRKSFEASVMYNFEKIQGDFALRNHKYITEDL